MPYSGQSIHFYNKQLKSGAIDYYRFGRHLLEATALLLTRGVVHYDLHKGNILIDTQNTPTIIDFGLSWQVKLLPQIADDLASRNFEPEYAQYSPELSIPEAVYNGLPLNDTIFREILEKKRVSGTMERLLGIPFESALQELRAFTYDSVSIKRKDWMKFYQTYWPKFDAWAVGRILLEVYYAITTNTGYMPTEKDAVYARVLRGLCAASPKKRLNAAQALAIWDPESPVLNVEGVAAWLK
jgi:serine/threonine protein kinase